MANNNAFYPFSLKENNLFLSHLLPYDPAIKIGNRLIDGLKEYLLVLNAAEQAIRHLEKGELKYFDPLVGENACQIRAVKLALIISHCTFDINRLLKALDNSKTKTKELLNYYMNADTRIAPLPSLASLLDQIDIFLLPEEHFLIKSYLLTRAKVMRIEGPLKPLVMNEKTDYKKIKEFGDSGSLFTKLIVNSLRKQLAKSSVKFTEHLSESSFDQWIISHNGLDCIPYFWSTKIVMDHAFKHQIPILLITELKAKDQDYKVLDQIEICFQPTSEKYIAVSQSVIDQDRPMIVLYGSTCRDLANLPKREDWIKELSALCPREVVLAYAASHRQYPDESKVNIFTNYQDQDYQYYKSKALEWGCSLENPSLFFLAHAYCDKLKNVRNFTIHQLFEHA